MTETKKHPTSDYSVVEACSILNCTPPTIYKMMKRGELASYKVGRSRRITAESIERLRAG